MTLFKGIPKDPTCANIKWMKSNRAPFYQNGYKLAADKLCNDFEFLHVSEKESLIFPIIFLHRHYIELCTKDIIYKLRRLLSINDGQKITNHMILTLWDEARRLYCELIPKLSDGFVFVSDKELEKSRNTIKELAKSDAQSFSFRYSTDKNGNTELDNIDYISLNNFRSEISIIITTIEGIFETIVHAEDFHAYQEDR